MPLAVAIFLWNLLEAMIQGFARVEFGAFRLPRWLATLLGIAAVLLGLYLVFSVLLGQADAVAAAWPRYVARFETIVSDLTQWLGPGAVGEAQGGDGGDRSHPANPRAHQLDAIDCRPSVLLVLAYVAFLFAESGYVGKKIAAMFPDEQKERKIRRSSSPPSPRASGATSGSRPSPAR